MFFPAFSVAPGSAPGFLKLSRARRTKGRAGTHSEHDSFRGWRACGRMLPLFTADASEKVVGIPPIDLFNRLGAAVRCGPFALPADSDATGRAL